MSKVLTKKKTILYLCFAAIMMLTFLLYINNRTAPKASLAAEGKNKLSLTGEVAAVSNSSSIVYCVKNLLLEAQSENVRVKDIDGNVVWSQKLPGIINKLAGAGDNIIIIDSQNNINYYSLQGKLLWTHKSAYEIIDIFTEDSGSFLVEYKGLTGSHAEVFIQSGSKVGSISIDNGRVLSFAIGESSFSISIIDTSTDSIVSKIITYNFKGDILWAQNFENRIISGLSFNNGRLLALGENSVYIYKNDGALQSEANIHGTINSVAINENIVAAAITDKGKHYAICYDASMKEQSRTEIKEEPLGIYPMKNSFILYYSDELLVLTSKGELTSRYKSNVDINSVYMTKENKVFIVSNRTLQMLEYIKKK